MKPTKNDFNDRLFDIQFILIKDNVLESIFDILNILVSRVLHFQGVMTKICRSC